MVVIFINNKIINNKINLILPLLVIVLLASGCNSNKNKIQKHSIDDLYTIIKQYEFNEMTLDDLNYSQINQTSIIVNSLSFGSRELLQNDDGILSQRILSYTTKDGTKIIITFCEISTDISIENNILSVYNDDLKNIGFEDAIGTTHIDSSIFVVENTLLNILSVNIDKELNSIQIAKIKENIVSILEKNILNKE